MSIGAELLSHEEGYLFRPLMRGLLSANGYLDGTYDLEFISTINDLIDIQDENERRLTEYHRKNA